MNNNDLIVEARARITWGEEAHSVRLFLISNGMSEGDANDLINNLTIERHLEIRKLGIKDVFIGVSLLGTVVVFLYLFIDSAKGSPISDAGSARGYAFFIILALYAFIYGLWRLLNGIIRLVHPKNDEGSIPDISE